MGSKMQEFVENDVTAKPIWDGKYLGVPFDKTMKTMVKEVFSCIKNERQSSIEEALSIDNLEEEMVEILCSGKALPAGRVLFYFCALAAGSVRKTTPMNCFVIPIKDDSLDAILQYNKEMGCTFKMGGGVGTTISGLRPKNSPVNNSAITSTGPASFLSIFNTTATIVGQNHRRGALMKAISIYHPDVEEVIQFKMKHDMPSMNISIMVDKAFMEAEENEDILLWYPEITNQIPHNDQFKEVKYIADCYSYPSYDFFFIKETNEYRAKARHKTVKKGYLLDAICEAAHTCGDPGIMFWDRSCMDWQGEDDLHCSNPCQEEPLPAYGNCNLLAQNFSKYNIDKDIDQFHLDTKICTIFSDTLITYAIKNDLYPLQEQKEIAEKYRHIGLGPTGIADFFILHNTIYGSDESIHLMEKMLQIRNDAIKTTSTTLSEILDGKPNEMRNSQTTTFAPTGSISMLLGCSPGIEPNYEYSYEKIVNDEYMTVTSPILQKAQSQDLLVTAYDISYENRLKLQDVAQQYTDGSISSTINLPNTATKDDIKNIYIQAHKHNLKGVTIYRDGSKKIGGLRLKKTNKRDILDGKTVKVPLETSWYITVNFDGDKPVELFINAGKSGSDTKAWTEGLGRLASLYLQNEGSAPKLIDALSDIKGQHTIFKDGWSIQSGPDAIAQALSHILSYSPTTVCPECGKNSFILVEGCGFCKECGYSSC